MKKVFKLDADIVKGVALMFDYVPDEVESEDIESALLNAFDNVRARCQAKADALQEIIQSQYIPYQPEEEKND